MGSSLILVRLMIDATATLALTRWGLEHCPLTLIATRENRVFRVDTNADPLVMRLHRPGYRTTAELRSELLWMAELERGGMQVPRPVPTLNNELCIEVSGVCVDVLTFISGGPIMKDGKLLSDVNLSAVAVLMGVSLAKLHELSDQWMIPQDFARPQWNGDGLLGDSPVWGRFWENPKLSSDECALLQEVRQAALEELTENDRNLDYGLIHADAVPENILIAENEVHLIDFDDGGFGYRLFDLATSLNRLERHDTEGETGRRFLDGYLSVRQIDLTHLPLFRLLRSLTYVGWVIDRMNEPGSQFRCARFIAEATTRAKNYFDEMRMRSSQA
jgi:Ser/Thr protein kinase RdoA (MazF antagonist)